MNRIKEIANRANLDTFITYIIDGVDVSVDKNLDECEKAIEESYDIIIAKIKEWYPDISTDDNGLLDALTEFAFYHDECYFKLVILVGERLQRELVKGYDKLDSACVK